MSGASSLSDRPVFEQFRAWRRRWRSAFRRDDPQRLRRESDVSRGRHPGCAALALTFGLRAMPRPRGTRGINFAGALSAQPHSRARRGIHKWHDVRLHGGLSRRIVAGEGAADRRFFSSPRRRRCSPPGFSRWARCRSRPARLVVARLFLARRRLRRCSAFAGQTWLIVVCGDACSASAIASSIRSSPAG